MDSSSLSFAILMAQVCPQPAAPSVSEFGSNLKTTQMINEETRVLKTRHNALIPIAQLPSELLSAIFQFVQAPILPAYYSSLSWRDWMTVSYVCAHWRRIALESPSLWSHISIDNVGDHNWVGLFLGRSRMAPLTLSATITPESQDIVRATLTNMGRMRRLSLSSKFGMSESSFELLDILETRPAPLLETFEMNYTPTISGRLLARLFAGHSPSLRNLTFFCCDFSWDLAPLKSLVHLEIRHRCPSLFQLASILRNTPNVEYLTVMGVLPPSPLDVDIGSLINLPHLSVIKLGGGVRQCTKLLEQISYPATSLISIHSFGHSEHTLTSLTGVMGCVFNSPRVIGSRPPIRHLRVISSLPRGALIAIEAWHDPGIYERPVNPQIQLSILTGAKDLNGAFWNALVLEDLVCLDTVGIDSPKSFWMGICIRLERLKILKVMTCTNIGFTNLLELLSSVRPGMQEKTLYFPALRGLLIAGWDFAMYQDDKVSEPLGQLIGCLKTRRDLGAGIERIDIEDCYDVLESGVQELAKLVPHVAWNGKRVLRTLGGKGAGLEDEGGNINGQTTIFSQFIGYNKYHNQ